MKTKQQTLTRKLVTGGVMAAIIAAFTLIQIPIGIANGYVNLGDVAIFAAAVIFPEYWFCAAAAGIGSAVVDVLSGWAIYAPATFVIKGLLALVAVVAKRRVNNKVLRSLVFIPISLIVPAGYFIYECILGYGTAVAFADAAFNCMQSVLGAVAGGLLGIAVMKARKK